MSDNNLPDPAAIAKAEAQGLVFSDDNTTLLECTNKEITEVIIPDGVYEIYENVFAGCIKLTSVVIPDSVTEIGCWAFSGCSNLKHVVIPDSVTSIGFDAFEGAGCEKQVKQDYSHLFE